MGKMKVADDDTVRRTPTPTGARQLATLVVKQVRVDVKAPGNFLLRTFLGAAFLCLYGLSNLSAYNSFYRESNATINTFPGIPMEFFSIPAAMDSLPVPWIEGSTKIWLASPISGLAKDVAEAMVALNKTDEGELRILDDVEDESDFKERCTQAEWGSFMAGIYLSAGAPDYKYSVFLNGSSVPSTILDSNSRDYQRHGSSGFLGIQRAVDEALMVLEGVDPFAAPTAPGSWAFVQALPLIENPGSPQWFIVWLPGFYMCVGVMFMLNFYVTPLIRDQRLQVVRQFVLLGVPRFVYWAHWIVVFSAGMVFSAITYTIVFILFKFAPLANGGLLFVNTWLFFVQFAGFVVLIPVFVKTEQVASIVPFLAWIISSAVYIPVIMNDMPFAIRCIMTVVNPWWATFHVAAVYVEWDWIGFGKGVTTETAVAANIPGLVAAQVGGVIFYLLLVYQLNAPKRTRISHNPDEDRSAQAASRTNENLEPLPADADIVLNVANLQKKFETPQGACKRPIVTRTLKGLDMQVCRGEVFGFLGHNGAGKTTAISILSGELLHDGGSAEFRFRHSSLTVGTGNDNLIRTRIGVCPQHDILFEDLSCREHLRLFAELKGGIAIAPGQSHKEAIEAEVQRRLDDVKFTSAGDEDNAVKTYSGGMKRKVSIAISLLGDPEVVFMDEPTAGMDPYNRRQVWTMIAEAKVGRSIILTTHFMDEADLLSDRIGILNKGHLVAQGSSLFLKHKFGAGYTLTYTVSKGRSAEAKALVTKVIESASLKSVHAPSSNQTEVHAWMLAHETEPKFPRLLNALHDEGCSAVSVDLTTLEQVFLATGAEGTGEEDEEGEDGAGAGEHHVQVDSPADTVGHIWSEKETEGRKAISWWQRVVVIAKVTARQSRRDTETIIFSILMPIAYMAGGFIAGFFLSGDRTEYPPSIEIEPSAIFVPDRTAPVAAVFGVPPLSSWEAPEGISLSAATPGPSVESFLPDDPHKVFNLGGILAANATLMFNGTMTQSPPVLHSLMANYTFAAADSNASVHTTLVPLPFVPVEDFPILPFLLPMFLGIGFMPLAFLVIDLAFYKEYQLYSVFRLMGVSRAVTYAGVALQTLVISFIPFLVIAITLALALQNPLAGSGGRWLAFILLMVSYCLAVLPFGMMFEPLFQTIEQAKNWFPFIYVAITILPFMLFSVALSNVEPDTVTLIGDLLCIIPPMAFQRGLQSILDMSNEYDDPSVTWSTVFAWESRILLCVMLMIVMSMVCSVVVILQIRSNEAHGSGGDRTATVSSDPDVLAEREFAFESTEGINARDVVKTFKVAPDTSAFKFRYIDLTYWLRWLVCCKDPFEEQYGTKFAVKGLSFGIKPNELFVLLGPNGAGKSTILKVATRDLLPDGGQVVMGGQEETTSAAYNALYRGGMVSYCSQSDTIFPNLTVAEHFDFVARLRGLDPSAPGTRRHLDAVEAMLGLGTHRSKPSRYLSGGYKRKLCLAMALIGFPELCLFDEISTGVDPGARHMLWSVLKPELNDGVDEERLAAMKLPAILLSTHYMDEAQELAKRVGIMIDGEMITTGTVNRLKEKHCNKNFLELTFKPDSPADCEERAVAFFQKQGLQPTVLESLVGRVKMHFPVTDMASNTKNLARLFSLVEGAREDLSVEFYSVALMNLEQIFIELSKHQFDADQEAGGASVLENSMALLTSSDK